MASDNNRHSANNIEEEENEIPTDASGLTAEESNNTAIFSDTSISSGSSVSPSETNSNPNENNANPSVNNPGPSGSSNTSRTSFLVRMSQLNNLISRPNGKAKHTIAPHKRISIELAQLTEDPPPDCTAQLQGDDLYAWQATIKGPIGSPYEGGTFTLDIQLSPEYPYKPPRVTFRTRIYHCNINGRGIICLDILNENWSPALTIGKILLSISSLLNECNPEDPLLPNVGLQYMHNRTEHDRLAKLWTKRYAK